MPEKKYFEMAKLLYEFGTLRRLQRMHHQMLLTLDPTDNIASHTARTAFIGLIIAQHEGLDVGKVVAMCLLHDLPEARSNDHNWVNKRYVTVHENEIIAEQFGEDVFADLRALMEEYEERKTLEAMAAKDADLIDELLLIVEHAQTGNREAAHWLSNDMGKNRRDDRLSALHLPFSRNLMEAAYDTSPTAWWKGLWTSKNR